MQKPETTFRRKVAQFLATLNPPIFYESIQQKTISGTPDILACVRGDFVAIEIKSEKGKLSPLQAYKLQKIIDADGIAISVTPKSFPEFKLLMEEINSDQDDMGYAQ